MSSPPSCSKQFLGIWAKQPREFVITLVPVVVMPTFVGAVTLLSQPTAPPFWHWLKPAEGLGVNLVVMPPSVGAATKPWSTSYSVLLALVKQ